MSVLGSNSLSNDLGARQDSAVAGSVIFVDGGEQGFGGGVHRGAGVALVWQFSTHHGP